MTQEMVWTNYYDDVLTAQKEKVHSKWWQCQNLHGKWWGGDQRLRVRPYFVLGGVAPRQGVGGGTH